MREPELEFLSVVCRSLEGKIWKMWLFYPFQTELCGMKMYHHVELNMINMGASGVVELTVQSRHALSQSA